MTNVCLYLDDVEFQGADDPKTIHYAPTYNRSQNHSPSDHVYPPFAFLCYAQLEHKSAIQLQVRMTELVLRNILF